MLHCCFLSIYFCSLLFSLIFSHHSHPSLLFCFLIFSFCPFLFFPYIPSLSSLFTLLHSSLLIFFHSTFPIHLIFPRASILIILILHFCSLLFPLFSCFFIFSHACLSCHPPLIFSNCIFSCPVKQDKNMKMCCFRLMTASKQKYGHIEFALLCLKVMTLDGTHLNSSFFFLLLLLHFNASFHQR